MGSGLAKNLIKNGFATVGHDLSEARMSAFTEMGGVAATNPAEVGAQADVVFVMVMHGDQAREVIFGGSGLRSTLKPGSAIILTATIHAAEAQALGDDLEGSGIHLIDSPVSGGFPGAQGGTLTMMAAGVPKVLDEYAGVMQAVSKTIHRVGVKPGMGQTVKACLQSLIGSAFSATFEASTLAAKAGVDGQVLYDVFSTSGAGCGVVNTALENIIDEELGGVYDFIYTSTTYYATMPATPFLDFMAKTCRDGGCGVLALFHYLNIALNSKYQMNQILEHDNFAIIRATLRVLISRSQMYKKSYYTEDLVFGILSIKIFMAWYKGEDLHTSFK